MGQDLRAGRGWDLQAACPPSWAVKPGVCARSWLGLTTPPLIPLVSYRHFFLLTLMSRWKGQMQVSVSGTPMSQASGPALQERPCQVAFHASLGLQWLLPTRGCQ